MIPSNILDLFAIGLALLAFVLGVGAIVAYVYVERVVGDGVTRSRELRRLVSRNRRVALSGGIIAALVAYTLVRLTFPEWGIPIIPPPWTTICIGIAVNMLLWGVIADAIAFYRLRRDGVHPPQSMDGAISDEDLRV
jgi:hypothetical protein